MSCNQLYECTYRHAPDSNTLPFFEIRHFFPIGPLTVLIDPTSGELTDKFLRIPPKRLEGQRLFCLYKIFVLTTSTSILLGCDSLEIFSIERACNMASQQN